VASCFVHAHAAQRDWEAVSLDKRTAIVREMVQAVAVDDEIAKDMTMGVGKVYSQARAELAGFAGRAEELIDLAPAALAGVVAEGHPEKTFGAAGLSSSWRRLAGAQQQSSDAAVFDRAVARTPAGVVLAFTPWNYPLLTAAAWLVPGLLAGNAVVLSPSPQAYPALQRLRAHAIRAGVPPNAIQVVHAGHASLWAGVGLASEAPSAPFPGAYAPNVVAFTGSEQGGASVAREAGVHAPLAQVFLELGGLDAVYVSEHAAARKLPREPQAEDEDVDPSASPPSLLQRAAEDLAEGAWWNAGQSCCAPQRVLVHRAVAGELRERLQELLSGVTAVDPREWLFSAQPDAETAAIARPRPQGLPDSSSEEDAAAALARVSRSERVLLDRTLLRSRTLSRGPRLENPEPLGGEAAAVSVLADPQAYEQWAEAAAKRKGPRIASLAVKGAGARVREDIREQVRVAGEDCMVGPVGGGEGDVVMPGAVWCREAKGPMWERELFGPAMVVAEVESVGEALGVANNTGLGLTASIYTDSREEAAAWAQGAVAGAVMVNRCDYVDPAGVWCGRRGSGRGEAGGVASFLNVTRAKGIHARWWK
jgi:acyl-CoA reductase-like NAD-dependent aldehyde dehydrogenase